MKKDLPAKGSEWVRLILSILVLLAFVPLSLYAIPKVMALGAVSYTHLTLPTICSV